MKKILIIVNNQNTIYKFRMEFIKELVVIYDVYLLSPNGNKINEIENIGVKHINSNIGRRSKNPIKDYFLYKEYLKTIKQIKPDLVLTYTIKPNIYGSLAAKKMKVPHVASITGLGSSLNKSMFLKKLTTNLYKSSFKKVNHVFFQNSDNLKYFLDNKIIKDNYTLTSGSGVNLRKFKELEYPKNDVIRITYIGRLMEDKGTNELLEVVSRFKEDSRVKFDVVGFFMNDSLHLKDKLDEFNKEKLLTFHGETNDVIQFIKQSDAIINPSYHEGMSNILLESAASARPVLASNIPGCIETFDEGITGIGFEPKNTNSMIDSINKFISMSYEERKKMGLNGRIKIEQEFDRNIVVNKYIEKIEKILKGND